MQPREITQDARQAVEAAKAYRGKRGNHAIAYVTPEGYAWVTEGMFWNDPEIHPFQCFYWTRRTGMDQRDLDAANHYITEQRERMEQANA